MTCLKPILLFSVIRSVIHATHREGERDTTNWCEWLSFSNRTFLPPVHNPPHRCPLCPLMSLCPVADCITDPVIVCDDLLWYCPHRWRVQRNGCILRAEKQVGPRALSPLTPRCSVGVVVPCHRGHVHVTTCTAFIASLLWIRSHRDTHMSLSSSCYPVVCVLKVLCSSLVLNIVFLLLFDQIIIV